MEIRCTDCWGCAAEARSGRPRAWCLAGGQGTEASFGEQTPLVFLQTKISFPKVSLRMERRKEQMGGRRQSRKLPWEEECLGLWWRLETSHWSVSPRCVHCLCESEETFASRAPPPTLKGYSRPRFQAPGEPQELHHRPHHPGVCLGLHRCSSDLQLGLLQSSAAWRQIAPSSFYKWGLRSLERDWS